MEIKATLTDYVQTGGFARQYDLLTKRKDYAFYMIGKYQSLKKTSFWNWARDLSSLHYHYHARLVVNQIIPHDFQKDVRECINRYGKTKHEIMKSFRIKEPNIDPAPLDALTKIIMKRKKEAARLGLMSSHKSNLDVECNLAHKRGWFIIFQTLTIKDDFYDQVFTVGDKKFSRYIRTVTRSVGKALGLSARASDKNANDIHRYFAVIEFGAKTARGHIHILHFVKKLPYGASDPNGYRISPTHREIEIMKSFWPYAKITAPIAMRYGADDAYSRIGWKWPHVRDVKTGALIPRQCGTISMITNYVCKYVNKCYGDLSWEKTTNIRWRIRTTRQFGRIELLNALTKQPGRDLIRFLMENKNRNPYDVAAILALPSYRKMRSCSLTVLMRRNGLTNDFLELSQATPILRRGRLTEEYFKTLRLKSGNFILSKQQLIDAGIFRIVQALKKTYSISNHDRVVNITGSRSTSY